MKRNLSRLFTFVALIAGTASAQTTGTTTLNTVPEGLLALSIAATDGTNGQPVQTTTNYFSLPLAADPVYTGAVSAVTSNTIAVADSPAPFVNGNVGVQLGSLGSRADEPFFVKFLTGAETGRVVLVTSSTSGSLTLDTTDNSSQTTSLTTSGFAVAANDTFEVFPGTTLSSVFGNSTSGNSLQLHGASSPFSADSVSIYNSATAKFQTYYFNTTSNQWQLTSGSSANATNTVIFPYSALVVTRRASQAAVSLVPMARITSIASSGGTAADVLVPVSRVPEVAGLTKTTGSGSVVFGSTQYPVNMTLSQLQFGSSWVKSDSLFSADTVSVWDSAAAKFDTYYQRATDSTWRKTTDSTTDVSSLVIPAGTAITVLQRASVSGPSSFLSSSMPYTLN